MECKLHYNIYKKSIVDKYFDEILKAIGEKDSKKIIELLQHLNISIKNSDGTYKALHQIIGEICIALGVSLWNN